MRTIRQGAHRTASQTGQTIYQTMLIISCVALALAVFFPVYELFDLYRGPTKFGKGTASVTPRTQTPEPTEEPEPAADMDVEGAPETDMPGPEDATEVTEEAGDFTEERSPAENNL